MKRRTHPTNGRWINRLSLVAAIMLLNLSPTACRSQAEESDPKKLDAQAWTQRGENLEQQQRYPLAVACYGNAIEADPDYAAAYFSRSAILADKNHDYRAAVADLTEYLRLRPRDFSGLFNRAMYQNQLRDFDGAIADYTKAIASTTDFSSFGGSADEARAHALHYRGRIYHWQKADPQKAIADYTESLKRDPTVDRLYYRRAVAHQALKNYEQADQDFKIAFQREPDFHQLRNAWAWQLATCPEKKYRNGKRALLLAKHPDTIAAAYAELGLFDNAIEYQQNAIALEQRQQATAEQQDETRLAKLKQGLERLQSHQPIRD